MGAFALVRSDVSDTLPGVAIAISLVPPLAVVGLTLESGKPHQATGALLLFMTNVAAILLSGLVVMGIYHVREVSLTAPGRRHRLNPRTGSVVAIAAVLALAVPLAAASKQISSDELRQSDVNTVAQAWATGHGWQIVGIDSSGSEVVVRAIGPLPLPDPESFRSALDAHGLKTTSVRLQLAPVAQTDLPGG